MILVVDDDPEILLILEMFLQTLSLECMTATSGQEALKIIASHKIDILITDYNMPGMDGLELLKTCRREKFHFPVIMISGNANRIAPKSIVLDDCCASLLAKPIAFDVLERAIQAAKGRNHHSDCVHMLKKATADT